MKAAKWVDIGFVDVRSMRALNLWVEAYVEVASHQNALISRGPSKAVYQYDWAIVLPKLSWHLEILSQHCLLSLAVHYKHIELSITYSSLLP